MTKLCTLKPLYNDYCFVSNRCGRFTNFCCCFRRLWQLSRGVCIGSVCNEVTKLQKISHIDGNKCHVLCPKKREHKITLLNDHIIIDFEKKKKFVIVTCVTRTFSQLKTNSFRDWNEAGVTKIFCEKWNALMHVQDILVSVQFNDVYDAWGNALQNVVSWRLPFDSNSGEKLQMWRRWFTRLAEYNTVVYNALSVVTQRYMLWRFQLWRDKCASSCSKNQ